MDNKKYFIGVLIISIILSTFSGAFFGFIAGSLPGAQGSSLSEKWKNVMTGNKAKVAINIEEKKDEIQIIKIEEESSVITTVEKSSPAVVSIIISKDLPIIERYYQNPGGDTGLFDDFFGGRFNNFFNQPMYRQNGTQKQEVGGGSGFLVSADGYILTNRHVVSDEAASYTVLMNDETKHEAKVLAKDAFNDVAVLKIEGTNLPYIELGDSSNLKVGQSVITIGNSLGEFRNTVSTGVVSGLARNISAGETGMSSEELIDVIQTDAAINPGNSGGPLLNITGQVIGINTAVAQNAENIGFSIPINSVKNIYDSVKKYGRIVRPWLGVRYSMIDGGLGKDNNLGVDKGALIVSGDKTNDVAIVPGSPAEKAGLKEGDIIKAVDGEEINIQNPLSRLIGKYKVGDEIELKISRINEEKNIKIKLEEMK